MTISNERDYILNKIEEVELLENFVPVLNKKGQAKLAFVEANLNIVENKEGEELPKLHFRFVCEGAGESRIISYTGWIKEGLSENSKLGQILKGFKLVNFETPKFETVEEFDLENNFNNGKQVKNSVVFHDLLDQLESLEGVIILAELEKEKEIWHRPDPTTFDFPINKKGEYYRADVSSFKI